MGINMPCKTVIFAGDDVRLTALNYRQAAGRAGRRGFDLLGNVIFHGIPLERTHSLMSSRLPKLMGHFPMSTSLILRLLMLLHNSKETEFSKSTVNTLLKQPRLVIGGVSSKEQVLHHLRFSIEFLRRQQLIGPSGNPLNFSGMSSHMYFIEKSAFAFHVLLCSGFLSDVVRAYPKADQFKREKICENLIMVLAHIFGRRRASKGRETVRTLPPLPNAARSVLVTTNRETLATFSTYVTTFAKKFSSGSDCTLPFSGLVAGGPGVAAAPPSAPVARSSFVALSGHSDAFTSIWDLGSSLRSDIFLEAAAIPYINVDAPLNSYLLDFYRHGSVLRLAKENSILANKVWFLLRDFSIALATVTAGLMSYIRDGPGAYFDAEKIRVKDEDGDMPPEDGDEDEDEEATVVTAETELDEAAELASEDEVFMREESKERVREAVVLLRAIREMQGRFEEKFRAMWA